MPDNHTRYTWDDYNDARYPEDLPDESYDPIGLIKTGYIPAEDHMPSWGVMQRRGITHVAEMQEIGDEGGECVVTIFAVTCPDGVMTFTELYTL